MWHAPLAGVEFVEEIGGGLNFRRRRLLELTDASGRREGTLVPGYRDPLTRFGPEHQMVQDMMTIAHGFSARLYGLRTDRRQLDAALKQDASHVAGPSHQA